MGSGLPHEFTKELLEVFDDHYCKTNCAVRKMTTLLGKSIETCTSVSK